MKHLAVISEYHERTKHHPNRYAPSLGYMDWATQPDPFRRYHGTEVIPLPLQDTQTPPTYAALFDTLPAQPLNLATLSALLQFSMGLAAWKRIGTDSWALRCNASSGNLHPTEVTVILPPVEGISDRSIVAHYAPKAHALEVLATFDTPFWESLEKGAFLIGISSVLWREVWKYGERAFRYTQLDAGHAERALAVASRLNGWWAQRISPLEAAAMERLMGLDQSKRFIDEEREVADMVLCIGSAPGTIDLEPLLTDLPATFEGRANQLSHSHHPWEAITMIADATHTDMLTPRAEATFRRELSADDPARQIILKRRSAQAMDFGLTTITRAQFDQLLDSVIPTQLAGQHAAQLIIFAHDVTDLTPGMYLCLRDDAKLRRLKHLMRQDFLWETAGENLYLLEKGDFRAQAKFISCSQDIASDSAFSLGMLCEFTPQLHEHGPHRYKELYWECGAIGQQLYLEATALKLSATGIGCYLDDVMHRMLGLGDDEFQVLYHFTIGRAIIDMRLTTLPPYDKTNT
jgi:SagB-type dehydrogenase family enzyme